MPRPGYYQIRLTNEIDQHIRAVCEQLGVNPDERGAYARAIYFALRLVALRLMEGDHEKDQLP